MPKPAFWRQWHRWIGAPSAVFLAFAAVTGVLVAGTEFFGEDEATREANRTLVSDVRTDTPLANWSAPLSAAMSAAATQAPGAPVDKVSMELKGKAPVIVVYLGKATGGEDKRLLFDAKTGAFLKVDSYVDKPLLNRIHSGEAFGDGGLVVAMVWGIALLALVCSGFLLYWRLFKIERPDRTGLRKFFF